jgi:hypothetical protein
MRVSGALTSRNHVRFRVNPAGLKQRHCLAVAWHSSRGSCCTSGRVPGTSCAYSNKCLREQIVTDKSPHFKFYKVLEKVIRFLVAIVLPAFRNRNEFFLSVDKLRETMFSNKTATGSWPFLAGDPDMAVIFVEQSVAEWIATGV